MAKQTIGIGSAANDGTGDTLRSAFDKANDNFTELYDASSNSSTLNVLTYGADNTGATDSLAAFDAAIAAASAGDRIYIPTGTFSLSNTWTISKQVTVFGPGTITEASVLTPVIEVTADKVQLHDFTVSGIETAGNWSTSAATIHARCGIHINDGDDCLISRVRIVTKSTGIKLTAANRTTIRDVLWQGINLASQPASYAESAGLRTVSAIDVLVDGGSWTLGGRGMALEGVLTARVTIKSPTIYTCESDGIYIDDPSGVQILGGWIQGVDGYGINIEDGDTLTVSNVYVRSNTSASMFLGTGTVSSLKLNQSDLASLTFSTGTYDDVDLSGSDIATLTTTSGGTLKGVKGTPKSLSTVTHGATAGAPAFEFNVMAFGATADGTTDDTAAIQAAIDAAEAAGGGVVFFPKGAYAITSTISIKSGVTLSGDGRATILATADFTGSTYMLAVANTATGAGVEGITIDGDNRANKAFDFGDGGSDLFLRRCTIIDVASKAGETVGTWAVDVGGNSRVTIEDVRIASVNGTAGSGAQAIGIGGGNSNTAGLVIRGCDISGVVTGGVDADAINVFSSGSTTDTETRIESCRFADCDWRFIKVFGERVIVANNQGLLDSTPPQAHDSCIAVFASDVTVTGNDFRTSGGTTNYYVAGIETADASGFSPSRLVLSNNRISNSLSSGYASGDAAVVLKSQASTDEAISITGNVFSGFAIGVKIQGTATLDGVVINGNVFRNLTGRCLDISLRPNASYTATFAASGNTITDAGATFVTDGFQVGGKVRITGTSSNNATRTVTALSETVITVDSGIADEGPLSATLQGVSVLKGFVVTSNAFESSTTSSAVNLNGADLQGSVIMANVWDVSGSANALNNLITGQYAVGPNMLRISGADYPVGGSHDRPVTEASVTGAKTVTVGHRRSALVFADSGAANVTNFTEGFQGQTVTLFFTNGNTTITHGSTIKLNGGVDFVGSADDTLTLRNLSGIWYEVSRSVN